MIARANQNALECPRTLWPGQEGSSGTPAPKAPQNQNAGPEGPVWAVGVGSASPVLVDLSCAVLTLRLKNWRIVEAAEAGKLLWCFDVSATGRRRELRFWLAELGAVARGGWGAFGRLTPPEALNAIVGREAMAVLRVGTVTDIVAVERATVHEWMAAGRLTEAPTQYQAAWVTRASLVQFLAERWQGKGV